MAQNRHHTDRLESFRILTANLYALVVAASLYGIVGLYELARFETFAHTILIAMVTSYLVFSRPGLEGIRPFGLTGVSPPRLIAAWLAVYGITLLEAFLTKNAEALSRVVMLSWLVATPIALLLAGSLLRLSMARWYFQRGHRRKCVFLRMNDGTAALAREIRGNGYLSLEALGYFDEAPVAGLPIPRLGSLAAALGYIRGQQVDLVFVGISFSENPEVNNLVEALQDTTVSLYFVPESTLFEMVDIRVGELAGVPLLVATETPFLGGDEFAKRVSDIVLATLILILIAPLMLAIALAVKLSSPGPVLFRQERYGIGGKKITVYKFRTMKVHQDDAVRQATRDDARITPLGRFLRRTSLDELPQFLNVLAGSMSVVGPRPHAVEHNETYRKLIRGYMLRHKVKPGITGWAQINGLRGETETVEKMQKRIEYDIDYIQNWSLWLDLKIIARTILLVFHDRQAY